MRIENRKAKHEYFIEDSMEVGIVLQGWEIKAIRAGRMNIAEAYVRIIQGRPQLIGATITALPQASSHVETDPTRTRALLMHTHEIDKYMGKVDRAGYTLVPLNVHFSKGRAKMDIGLAKGKQMHDKRQSEKEADSRREAAKAMKSVAR